MVMTQNTVVNIIRRRWLEFWQLDVVSSIRGPAQRLRKSVGNSTLYKQK